MAAININYYGPLHLNSKRSNRLRWYFCWLLLRKAPLHPTHLGSFHLIFRHVKYIVNGYIYTHNVGRLKMEFIDPDSVTGDCFTKTHVWVYDTTKSLENGDRNTSHTFNPIPVTINGLDRVIFKSSFRIYVHQSKHLYSLNRYFGKGAPQNLYWLSFVYSCVPFEYLKTSGQTMWLDRRS